MLTTKTIKNTLIKDYTELNYYSQLRSGALLVVNLLCLIFLCLYIFTLITVQGFDYYMEYSMKMTTALAFVLISGIIALRYLPFRISGNYLVSAFLYTHLAMLFTKGYTGIEILQYFSSDLYISFSALCLSVIFSTRKMLMFNAAILLTAAWLLFFVSLKSAVPEVHRLLKSSIILFTIAVSVASTILYFSIYFSVKAQNRAKEFTKKIQAQDLKNQNLIDTVKTLIDGHQDFTTEVTQAVGGLSASTNKQAADLEEISAALEEIDSSAEQNAEQANRIDDFMSQTNKTVTEGNTALDKTSDSISKITNYIQVIEDIAFQTKILSINASIQASKAGEHGRGFSAIADEIQLLSQKSTEASNKVQKLIIENDKLSRQLKKSLETISIDVKKASEFVSNISASAMEQRSGTAQVNVSVSDVNKAAQTNAALAEKITNLQNKLTKDTRKLQQLLSSNNNQQL